jgi:DNA-binding GntR family transcriptional regulator
MQCADAAVESVNSDIAYDYIRQRILTGDYPPGHALTTSQLAEEIKVSRTPVRDALRQLESDGLVTIRPHYGARVKTMEFSEFREMCVVRLALESHAAGLAAESRTEAELREIRLALEAMRGLTEQILSGASEQQLLQDLVREDIRFHIAILTAAKNSLMKKEILRLHLINRIVAAQGGAARNFEDKDESVENRRNVLAEHEAIYAAIARADVDGAKSTMTRHIQTIINKQVYLLDRAGSRRVPVALTEEELSYTP